MGNESHKTEDANILFSNLWKSIPKDEKSEGTDSTMKNPLDNYADLYRILVGEFTQNQERWLDLQNRYFQEQTNLWINTFAQSESSNTQETPNETPNQEKQKIDKRFTSEEWDKYPVYHYIKQSYLLTSKLLMEAVEDSNLDAPTKKKMVFYTKQFVDAMAPSNYLLTNPEALKTALDTNGESLTLGFKNLLADLDKKRISMSDESAFEVGKNIAVTPGSVIFENQLMQLIQYAPTTPTVYERPLLFVPPCINKFYVMDLQPKNSLVRFAIDQGHTLFLISWKNVTEKEDQLTWDNYIGDGVIKAIEVVREISKQDQINALGFCIGGTLLACALAVLAKRKKDYTHSLTLMTALLEFSDVGDIGVYVDRHFVESREAAFKDGGIVPGKELAMAFSSLRANDFIWPYIVNNYLKGKSPEAFDLLYWNSDAANLPGPMFSYYLRNTYLENKLIEPNALIMCNTPLDLGNIKTPAYVFGAIEDHIVPWRGAYESTKYIGSDIRFVLGASGHIAGSMNSASQNRRNHWLNEKLPEDPEVWMQSAKRVEGSWWNDWAIWLQDFGGKKVSAPKALGSKHYKAIEPAPGRYVAEKHQ